MSDWGTEMDRVLALVRAGVNSVEVGALKAKNAERGVREGSELEESELPHAFLFDPTSVETELDFLQADVRTEYTLELWDSAAQERMAEYRDAIKDALRADNTLAGAVLNTRVASSGIVESVAPLGRRVLVMTIETRREEG